jgi:glycine/D-amino acid oxidase-like deaminating enzyme
MLNESNFWQTTISSSGFPFQPLPVRVDVVVIGAGFSSLSAALTLAKAGVSVAVVEAETVGWGASSRNGGMVLTGMKLGIETIIQRYGIERARCLFTLSLEAINTVEQIVLDEKIDCAFSRCGHLEVAWKPKHFEGYTRAAELLEKEFGYKVRILSRADQHEEIGSELYYGGMVDTLSAGVNPAQFVMGLAMAAAKAGAVLFEHTRILKVEPQSGKFLVHTSKGDIVAEKVFVGTSGYSGLAVPSLQKRIAPIGSYIIATAPIPEALARELNPHNRMIFDSKHYLYYFRLTPDQRLLFGGRAVFKPETVRSIQESSVILQKALLEVFPQLMNIPIDYVWGGSLDFSMDNMPHTGNLDGLYYSLGYAGHGVAFATHLGSFLARQMLGQVVDNPLDGLAFHEFPFYAGMPLYLPLAGLYYRWLDLIS